MKTVQKIFAVTTLALALTQVATAADSDFQYSGTPSVTATGVPVLTLRANPVYQGQFKYDDITYDPQTPGLNSIDLSILPSGDTYISEGGTVARFYKQDYSVVVGNTQKADPNRSFVKDVVGVYTAESVLPSTGSYTYNGEVFNHIKEHVIDGTNQTVSNSGTLTYTVDLAARTGSGNFAGVTGKRGGVYDGEFDLSGTLHIADIEVKGGVLGAHGGDVTLVTSNSELAGELASADAKYDMGVFGPNAEEVAGRIYGISELSGLGGFGLAGKRNP